VIDDDVSCTEDSCNEANDTVDNIPNDALCDNGVFCDGVETCDVQNDCQPGSDPCPGNDCDETGDICVVPPAGDVHVEAVLTTTQSAPAGKGQKNGVAQVTIYDENEAAVGAGYTVTGNFSGTFNENGQTAVTDANGIAVFVTSGSAKKGVVVNFCVSDVTGTLPFDPADHNSASFACGAPPTPVCGNGIIEVGEMCDGSDLGGETCSDQGFLGGTLACQADCQAFDTSACSNVNECVPTHSKEKGLRCSDGLDNDCDGDIDAADTDC
jgi:hypothetical protein